MSAASVLSSIGERPATYPLVAERFTGVVFFVADVLALLAAYTLTIVFRSVLGAEGLWPQYFRLLPFLSVVPVLIGIMDLYPGVMLEPVEEFRRLAIAISLGMSLVVVATFLLKDANVFSRLVFVAAIPVAVGLDLAARWLVRKVCPGVGWWGIPTVLVGPLGEAEVVLRMIEAHPAVGIRVVAVVHADRTILPHRAEAFASRGTIPYALVIVPSGADTEWVRNAERLVWNCKKIIVMPQSLGLLWSGMRIRDCCGTVGLAIRRQLLRPGARLAKRAMDFAAALGGGLLILPGVLIIALLVKLSSRGPVFYGHERIGEGQRTFRAWKFRTMVQSADHLLKHYLESSPELMAEWAANHKLRDDPRVTKIGRFLRQTSLDELPQVWNVILGEMSLVGPRPIVREEAERYGREIDLYQKVRPGITGSWQVSGRSDTSYAGRVAMDVHYVRNWSVWLDAYMLIKTVAVVLKKQGAY